MNTILRFEVAVGIITIDLDSNRLDTSLVAFEHISDFGFVALFFAPAEIHTHKHLSPVLSLSTTSTSNDFDNSAEFVLFATEHIAHFEVFDEGNSVVVCLVNFVFGHSLFFVEIVGNLHFVDSGINGIVAFNPKF